MWCDWFWHIGWVRTKTVLRRPAHDNFGIPNVPMYIVHLHKDTYAPPPSTWTHAHTRTTIMPTHTHANKLPYSIPIHFFSCVTRFGRVRVGIPSTCLCTLYTLQIQCTRFLQMASSNIHRCDASSIYVRIDLNDSRKSTAYNLAESRRFSRIPCRSMIAKCHTNASKNNIGINPI